MQDLALKLLKVQRGGGVMMVSHVSATMQLNVHVFIIVLHDGHSHYVQMGVTI